MRTTYPWLSELTLSEPDGEGKVLVSGASGPILRVPNIIGAVITAAQQAGPDEDVDSVAQAVSVHQTVPSGPAGHLSGEHVRKLLDTLAGNPALARIGPASNRRIQFRKPFSIQFTLMDPSRALALVPWLTRIIRAQAFWWSVAALNALGAVAVCSLLMDTGSALHDTTTVGGYLWLLIALYAAVFVHEMSHAATLVAFGGVSRRVGFMLFYLMPAFFCDVSDAWRLKPAERVKVALAGIAAQGVLGAIAGMLAFILPRDLATLAAVFSLLCFIYGLLNLIPFVKLDGYIALIGYLDKPNLRARCMQEFKDWTAHVFMRPTRRPARKSSPYRLIFGLLCIAFPLMILTGAVTAAGSYLAPLGRTATLVQLVLAGSLVAWLAMRGIGHWVALRKSGTTKAAVAAYSFVSCVVAAVVLFVVPFPNTIRGGLYTDNEGPKFVVLGGASGSTAGTVDLYTAGLAPGKKVGVATTSGPQEPCVVPLAATVAVKETELTLDAQCIPLGFDGAAPRLGTAAWTGQSQTIFTWFETSAQNLLAP